MITITGIKMDNPTILAAGVMGTTGSSMVRIAENSAGALVTKSVGLYPKEGHPNPTMIELESGGFLNAMGLPNPSYKNFISEIKKVHNRTETPVIASIFAGTPEDFVDVAMGLEPAKPSAFELNVSCPHAEGYGSLIGCDPLAVERVTEAVCDAVNIPVWVKLTPNVTDIVSIGKAAENAGADAVVAINTVKGMAIDINSGYPILGNRFGGLSGQPIKPIAVKCVYDLYSSLEIPVIGAGGISCWQDAVEIMMAGACGVQIGSAVFDRIDVFNCIASGIDQFMEDNSYSKIEDIIGIAHEMK